MDTLVHPHSELAKLLDAGDEKKAAQHHARISKEAIERGEFRPLEPKPGVYAGDGNMRGIFSMVE